MKGNIYKRYNNTAWQNRKIKTPCCKHIFQAVLPVIRLVNLECPNCGKWFSYGTKERESKVRAIEAH